MSAVRTAEDFLNDASALVVDDELDAALQSYTMSIELDPQLVKAFLGRAAVFLKLKRFTEALQDTNTALKLDPTQELGYYRKGLACFELDEFETALAAFKKGQELLGTEAKSRPYGRWIRKCETEIEDEGEDEEAMPSADDGRAAAMDVDPPAPPAAVPAAPQLRHQHYQSVTHLTLSVLEKKTTPDMVQVEIEPQRVSVIVQRPGQPASSLEVSLYDTVVPAESSFKVLSTKIEVKLKKAQPFQWPDLAAGGGLAMPAAGGSSAADTHAEPVRAYSSKRDWGAVDKAMEEELTKDKPEGEEALNELFRSIYSNANEDTRRAMNKSFQTSGGTVLSTNWDEVHKADYEKERQAPNGMEWQTWEGKKLPMKKDED